MERFTVAADRGLPVLDIKEIPPSYSPISTNPRLRDASFSSFLASDLPRPVNSKLSSDPSHRKTTQPETDGRPSEDLEISIFGAEKYYSGSPGRVGLPKMPPEKDAYLWNAKLGRNGGLSEFLPGPNANRASSVSSVEGYERNYRCTPTASSEASWNSQSGLLKNPPGSIRLSVRNLRPRDKKPASGSGRWRFGRQCPCICKKSIAVEENCASPSRLSSVPNSPLAARKQAVEDEPRKPVISVESLAPPRTPKMTVVAGMPTPGDNFGPYAPDICYRTEIGRQMNCSGGSFLGEEPPFSFPVLQVNGRTTAAPLDDPQRDSIDVYSPKEPTRRLVNLTAQSPRGGVTFPVARDDDCGSDSSSDLFEIESLSTTATSTCPIYRRRDSLDDLANVAVACRGSGTLQLRRSLDGTSTPPVAPSECYAPSEASVEWSVTTAEGFDQASCANFSSAVSEFGEAAIARPDTARPPAALPWRGGDLLGCRRVKSVSVAVPQAKCAPETRPRPPLPFPMEAAREAGAPVRLEIRAPEIKIMHVPEKRPLARPRATAFPHALAARVVS
ncbi:protein PHYTOCHROME KINASE SUBSTRATE 4-like [Nymphaea colorata]|uniref:protein PHYTOCHROME KINASE SUBSTRATE 4-like n=1 Tax=Nymphaea colorata TaxID=210225 RepID=UPI00129D4B65|nr:protein PHYTOCHROME KINASE SUBSTRATE 4-like [Nymphaea colorata]